MINLNKHIKEKLNSCALIIRKYDLGDKAYFFSKFPGMKRETLETAWDSGLQKIQNKEIIKNSPALGVLADAIVKEKLQGFENNAQSIFYWG